MSPRPDASESTLTETRSEQKAITTLVRVLAGLLPRGGAQDFLARIEPYGFFIVMGLVIAGVVSTWWLRPLMNVGYQAIDLLISPLTALLH